MTGIFKQKAGAQLSEKTFGIIVCGNVGKDLVSLPSPFNCKVLVYDIEDYKDFYTKKGVIATSIEELLKLSDIVSIHIPLNESSKNFIDANKIALMKPAAFLINTARGGIVDESALKNILLNGKLA
jgi:phosphoglycerate dehydrogenase-like enzyme